MATALSILYRDRAIAFRGASVVAAGATVSGFPASNVLHPDRDAVAKFSAATTFDLDVDLGASHAAVGGLISGIALLNCSSEDPVNLGPDFELFGSPTGFSGMSLLTSFGGAWPTTRNLITDLGGSVVSWRFWRFRIYGFGYAVTLGKVIVGTLATLPFAHSTDGGHDLVVPGVALRRRDYHPINEVTGAARRVYSMPFDAFTEAEASALFDLAEEPYPFGMIDAQGRHVHAIIPKPARTPFRQRIDGVWRADFSTIEELP